MCVGLINAQTQYVSPRNGRPGVPMGPVLDDIDAERANVEHLRQRSIQEIKRAIRQREDFENDRLEETLAFAAVAASHPITVARALMQFGFEPFEMTDGEKYYFFGPPTLFFPNLFSYCRKNGKRHSILVAGPSPVLRCPFEVIAKTRAIAGTMLMDRVPFYCRDHQGAWNSLSLQNAHFRGCSWFFRLAIA
ncbi:Protein CBG13149 [Caenorhabditis briggsae]|uniref:Protein CBG13149 n=1 Tax=Caenorhabditis briggsae TaxID=6238 RepID=A8XH64_CAEBR|nr:Protein CBG13149 [Caenorhabditis briggsae]CAP31988.2 Protein CBG13149 [Caenorhabditis briggsae]